jgi:hypothetical protein
MVEGCSNEMDPGSTQHLCRPCYDVITTGNTDKYYEDHKGSTWIRQIISWNHNLRQEVKELEYNQDHAYFREDDKYMSLNDLRNFYVDHNNLYGKALGSSVIDKRLLKDAQDALDKKNMENLSLIHENEALKKGHEQKDQHIDSLRKEIEALNYNIDHAHQIDFGKYMSLDDLCIFYQEHNNPTPKDDGSFQAYTNGFWKGFDMGYEKAKE